MIYGRRVEEGIDQEKFKIKKESELEGLVK